MSKKAKAKKLAARLGRVNQVAALPYRTGKHGVEVLVITSRRTKRLVIPKGWPMPGVADAKAAAIEAREEAGVRGRVGKFPLGSFHYLKQMGSDAIRVTASVFPLKVRKVEASWKERKQRKRRWLPIEQAAAELDDIGLRDLVQQHSRHLASIN
jgi:8-oxo-dGTP pyrophosphatase MutT (NUDIX family)